VKLALASVLARVVDVEEDHSGDGDAVHEGSGGQQGHEPPTAVRLLVVSEN